MRSAPAAPRNDPQAATRVRWLWRIACWIFLAAPVTAARAQATDDSIDVQAERNAGLIHVQARALLRAPMAVVWRTLTDYESLPAFIPGLASSRVVARHGAVVTVEQTGEARFLFLTVPGCWKKMRRLMRMKAKNPARTGEVTARTEGTAIIAAAAAVVAGGIATGIVHAIRKKVLRRVRQKNQQILLRRPWRKGWMLHLRF